MSTNTMKNFITSHIFGDIKKNTYPELAFRFPPEPNGYLHLGHAKSIILNSYLAKTFNGKLYLRLDDTNPETEKMEYVDAIIKDSKWLTLKDFDHITYTSDYFDKIHEAAILLIKKGLAYVDFSTNDELKNSRGGFGSSDIETKYRANSIVDNLKFFENMKLGMYKDGEAVLRAKIDLNHPNMNMRDPVMYRIKHVSHYRTGDTWCIYSTYDFAHPISDCLEHISHSLCTLEFEDHRILYDWYVDNCFDLLKWKPVELEFSRLEVEGIELSKRKLLNIVNTHDISWSNPVMPTISGLRNKGITPEILVEFIMKCGFSKVNSTIPISTFNESIRNGLKKVARIFAIENPIELKFTNENNFAENVIIEKNDVMAIPSDDFWRVYPSNWTRLKHGVNFLTTEVTDNTVFAELDEGSIDMKNAKSKAKVAIHWLRKENATKLTMKIYSSLIIEGEYNPKSVISKDILIDSNYKPNTLYEFERYGYAYIDENHIVHLLSEINK